MLATVVRPYSLSELAEGAAGIISEMCGSDLAITQLSHMGFVKGALVRVVQKSHLILVEIGQNRLALPIELSTLIQLDPTR